MCTAVMETGSRTSSVMGVGACTTNCGGSLTSSPLISCCCVSWPATGGLPVVSGVAGLDRCSPSSASVSLPERSAAEEGVGKLSVDNCGLFSSLSAWSASLAKRKLSRSSGTGSGTSAACCRLLGLWREEALRREVRAAEREVGSAERELWAMVLATEVVSVSGREEEWWRVAGADCLRRKKGRDSEKRTMAATTSAGHRVTRRRA